MVNAIGTIIGKTEVTGSGGPVYSPEYQAVLDRATTLGYSLPNDTQKNKDNTAIINLKSAGIWNLLDIFYGMTGNSDFATLNWKSPTDFQLSLVNSPSYDQTVGFTGNGTTSYITTNWTPSAAVNYTQNNAGIGALSSVEINTAIALYGASNATLGEGSYILPRISGTGQYRINQSSTTSFTSTTAIGRYHIKRTASNATAIFSNGSSIATGSVASTVRTTSVMVLLGINRAGTITNLGGQSVKCFWAGTSLNGLEASIDTIIQSIYA